MLSFLSFFFLMRSLRFLCPMVVNSSKGLCTLRERASLQHGQWKASPPTVCSCCTRSVVRWRHSFFFFIFPTFSCLEEATSLQMGQMNVMVAQSGVCECVCECVSVCVSDLLPWILSQWRVTVAVEGDSRLREQMSQSRAEQL